MNHYLFDRPSFYKYFNCTSYDINIHPIEERRDPIYGSFMVLGALFFEFAYIPVLAVLWQPSFQKESCYRIMSFIAIIDVIAIAHNGFLTGIFSILGVVYCSCPWFQLITGFIAYAAWLSESDLAIILAFNRCLYMLYPRTCEALFKGWRTYLWILGGIGHGLITSLLTGPLTYNSLYGVWLFNPHFGYPQPDYEFGNFWHPIHNIAVPVLLGFFYVLFAVTIIRKMFDQEGVKLYSHAQKNVFIQVFIIAMVNVVIALLYLYEQYFYTPKFLMKFSQAGWMCIHGAPCIVYLILNKSIRKNAIALSKKYLKRGATEPMGLMTDINNVSGVLSSNNQKHNSNQMIAI